MPREPKLSPQEANEVMARRVVDGSRGRISDREARKMVDNARRLGDRKRSER